MAIIESYRVMDDLQDLRQSKKDHGELLRFGINLTKTPKITI
ncbi:hypothetical protein BRARA_A02645 [Brassica rapa]|uniref:Uncharacterized protein n=1 Tax=Brassica campestris TaxID=3711 RepID=A0A398AX16_BRACM|nr:hypothetical protein BRARA_A02645 [Brassica rapa]